ncbi:MAG: DsbA family protein [Propionibacteriaceae bacterium]|jgi:protein-disulfide isomerase|nr:DsbA family protein [Propionibacteriaceae bacterium]
MSKRKAPVYPTNSTGISKREQLRQQQAAAARAAQTKRIITFAVVSVAVAALVIAIVVVALKTRSQNTPTNPVTPGAQITPPHVSSDGYSVIANPGKAKDGAITLEIHADYQCPACADYETYFGTVFEELAERGDIELRMHPRTMVGDEIVHNDSSQRANIAATCADTVDKFLDMHKTIFANQPEREGTGYTDVQLRETFPQLAGITGENLTKYLQCYDARQTNDWVTAAEVEGLHHQLPDTSFANGIDATPTFLANGKLVPNATLAATQPNADAVLAALRAVAEA